MVVLTIATMEAALGTATTADKEGLAPGPTDLEGLDKAAKEVAEESSPDDLVVEDLAVIIRHLCSPNQCLMRTRMTFTMTNAGPNLAAIILSLTLLFLQTSLLLYHQARTIL